ncbi:CDP-alcohol phosphatidyltransferase family protein [Vibrio mangrovi]|uniref:CDP-alcohol phosphatidyltransferase n=1 Tax=Vibrio mangrovi TaxID=474394 RepID=A0A1Y6IR93_9VIBR|nr:CDP-alcohol phosphatidyltransferase family protein [Vibrio mangrovi]MDW6004191.1 CDP-alcohol phosphatidyltransferase family protein [Vibrio mangrovi]SMR99012.1 CDP-alcohol phosphatidyltransferase [Vibrio mangrovi]
MNIIGIYNAPTRVTMLGLVSSVFACILALNGYHEFALVALIWAGIFDLFDGFVARRSSLTEKESRFGLHIDSIVDVVSFGITPAIIVNSIQHDFWSIAASVFYVCAAAQRLAYFNILQENKSEAAKYYLGLPVTFASLIFGIGLSLNIWLPPALSDWYSTALLLITGMLFITPFRLPKPKGLIYVSMPLLAILFSVFWLLQ